jgi:glucosamine-6-phosphate deaminase
MEIIIKKNYDAVCEETAGIILQSWRKKNSLVLGLPTGKTPVGLYERLVGLYERGEMDFSQVVTFNLDEYLGLDENHPQSFAQYMDSHLFRHVNIKQENTHLLSGRPPDIEEHCRLYERKIRSQGGIDIQVLGIGLDGHIAFDVPSSSLFSRTRLLTLTRETVEANTPLYENKADVPRFCLTMGVGTILESKMVILMASGRDKAEIVAKAIEGPVTASVPASALQLHPQAKFVIDEEAATELKNIDYYRWTAENKPQAMHWLSKKSTTG